MSRTVDNLFLCDNEAQAIADPILGAYYTSWEASEEGPAGGAWRGDVCIPGVTVDQIVPDEPDPETGEPRTKLQRWPYWYLIVSADVEALISHPRNILAIDWDANATLNKSLPEGTTLADFVVSPYFAGREPGMVV
jgi:hypothetical protein